MAVTHCYKRMKEGVVDEAYIDRRLDSIEARIDDLCGLLGSVLEALNVDSVDTTPKMDLRLDNLWGDNGG
jgi:hypothetical protein